MIVSKDNQPSRPLEIDLTGPEGNVFVLMGYAKRLAKEIYNNRHPDLEKSELDAIDFLTDGKVDSNLGQYICNKMMESDYENALNVFEQYFGEYVILYR